mgnify:CR=1 FL=1
MRRPMVPGRGVSAPILPPQPELQQALRHSHLPPTTLLGESGEFPQVLAPRDYPIALGPDGTLTTSIEIDAGHIYVIETWRAQSTGAFLCLIRDSASQIALMNKAVHSVNLFGTAQRPGWISMYDWAVEPFSGKRTFTLELTDLTGATNTIYLELWGHRRRLDPNFTRSGHTAQV